MNGAISSRGDGLEHSQPKSRTLRSWLLRVLVARIVIFGVTTTILGLARVLSVGLSAQPSADHVAAQMPSWTAADQRAHPRCVPAASWPRGRPAAHLVVYSFRDHVRGKVAFSDAWKRNHNDTEVDDIWVLGMCPSNARRHNVSRHLRCHMSESAADDLAGEHDAFRVEGRGVGRNRRHLR